jgi:hypothetical protein
LEMILIEGHFWKIEGSSIFCKIHLK